VGLIAISRDTSRREATMALRLGADDVVTEPLQLDELEARVAAVLRRCRA
jgi:DNA-binding response OmpR family regulator